MMASVGSGIVAGGVLTLALNKVLASWDAESARDPLLLLAAATVLAIVAGLPVPCRRAVPRASTR